MILQRESMKYIKERDNRTKSALGIALGCLYLFFTYLSGSIYIPLWLNRGTLILFLAYGVFDTVNSIAKGIFRLSKHTIWYGLFIGYTLISFSFSTYPREIYSNHFYQMIVCFTITLFLYGFINTEEDFCRIGWAYVLSSFIMIALLYGSGKLVGNSEDRLGNEALGNANVFATFIMYSVMYSLWLLLNKEYGIVKKTFLSISLLSNLYALILSGGRKFFLACFVFLYVLLIFRYRSSFIKSVAKYTIIMAVLCICVFYLINNTPALYNAIGVRMEQLINSITGNGKVDESAIIRSNMRNAAIQEWIKSPLIGYGFNTFQYLRTTLLFSGGSHGYSHCNYTELLYSGGIIYALVYYSYMIYIVYVARKRIYDKGRYFAFVVAAIVSQLLLDYGGVFYDIVASQIFIMMTAVMLKLSDVENMREGDIIHG